eukprot:976883-Pleurochrysis_carterae.AAC.1
MHASSGGRGLKESVLKIDSDRVTLERRLCDSLESHPRRARANGRAHHPPSRKAGIWEGVQKAGGRTGGGGTRLGCCIGSTHPTVPEAQGDGTCAWLHQARPPPRAQGAESGGGTDGLLTSEPSPASERGVPSQPIRWLPPTYWPLIRVRVAPPQDCRKRRNVPLRSIVHDIEYKDFNFNPCRSGVGLHQICFITSIVT